MDRTTSKRHHRRPEKGRLAGLRGNRRATGWRRPRPRRDARTTAPKIHQRPGQEQTDVQPRHGEQMGESRSRRKPVRHSGGTRRASPNTSARASRAPGPSASSTGRRSHCRSHAPVTRNASARPPCRPRPSTRRLFTLRPHSPGRERCRLRYAGRREKYPRTRSRRLRWRRLPRRRSRNHTRPGPATSRPPTARSTRTRALAVHAVVGALPGRGPEHRHVDHLDRRPDAPGSNEPGVANSQGRRREEPPPRTPQPKAAAAPGEAPWSESTGLQQPQGP